ncbi:hypothetical protein PMI32_04946 [Pseudomonas sp. GM60]|nr:hypothetical protein PMI32_04946 [Pseudomonas sp. GM60]
MDVNENACYLAKRGVLESFASRLAPTIFEGGGYLTSRFSLDGLYPKYEL